MNAAPFKHLTALQFAKLLPGVDRKGFGTMFEDPLGMFIVANGAGIGVLERKKIKGQTLAMAEIEGIEKHKRVDARAAGAILRLYLAGALPMLNGRSPEPALSVEKYVTDAATAEREAKDRVKRAVTIWQGYLDGPATVPESTFSIRLLNEIFIRHLGMGGGTLEIGAIAVTKTTPYPHLSNSGKSNDWSYHFIWRSADGNDRRLSRQSAHAGDRRSDPDRNGGLGRE